MFFGLTAALILIVATVSGGGGTDILRFILISVGLLQKISNLQ